MNIVVDLINEDDLRSNIRRDITLDISERWMKNNGYRNLPWIAQTIH